MNHSSSVAFFLCTFFTIQIDSTLIIPSSEPTSGKQWKENARKTLDEIITTKTIKTRAKNVILFIGDGMDITTITAARILKGQEKGHSGPEDALQWDRFEHVALSKTYNTDEQVPDSAGTATAYVGGAKTRAGVVGYDESVERGRCSTTDDRHKLDSFFTIGGRTGFVVGVVTTTRITHASPAATYAYSAERDWESAAEEHCEDIASQLANNDHGIRLFLGGGRREFLPQNATDVDGGGSNKKGKRRDDRHVVEEWKTKEKTKGYVPHYVWNKDQLDALTPSANDSVLGLFAHSHLAYDKRRDVSKEPSLAEMVAFAVQFLKNARKDDDDDDKGFLLFVEAGRIDHGHHDGRARDALYDTLALDAAVAAAGAETNMAETLIVVTADHGHAFSFAGYQSRGNPIFNAVDLSSGSDGFSYSSLLYANGPGYRARSNETNEEMNHVDYRQIAGVPKSSESHGGADVAIYARGPFAHLFRGVMQQNVIPHVIAYAACIHGFGDLDVKGLGHCGRSSSSSSSTSGVDVGLVVALVVIGLLAVVLAAICGYVVYGKRTNKRADIPVTYSNGAMEP